MINNGLGKIKNLLSARKNRNNQEYLIFWLENMSASLSGDALADWFRSIYFWISAETSSQDVTPATRLRFLIQTLQKHPEWERTFAFLLKKLFNGFRGGSHFAEIGLIQQESLFNEVKERLLIRTLPHGALTENLEEFVRFVFGTEANLAWLEKLDESTLDYFRELLGEEVRQAFHEDLMEALLYLGVQIQALGLQSEFRSRLKAVHLDHSAFYLFAQSLEQFVYHRKRAVKADLEIQLIMDLGQQCELELQKIYQVLNEKGVSNKTVYQMTLMRHYLDRAFLILEILEGSLAGMQSANVTSKYAPPRLFVAMVEKVQERSSFRQLVSENMKLMAHTITDRVAATGEHYMVKSWSEYKEMLVAALGGGFVTAFTVFIKVSLGSLALSALMGGVFASVNYAISFLVIQWVGFTLGTKQPAMTAAALARKLKTLKDEVGKNQFLEEVQAILRSQSASIVGNLLMVIPTALVVDYFFKMLSGRSVLNLEQAEYALHSVSLLSAAPLFAMYTGVLLWASSIFSGWFDNWFTLRGLTKRLAHNRWLVRALGENEARQWAESTKHAVGGVAANVSLAFLLGLTPPLLKFIGIPLDVRHITLSTGQLAAALPVLGLEALRTSAFLWAILGLVFIAFLNVGVSFYLALKVAMRAQGVPAGEQGAVFKWVLISFLKNPRKFFFP